MIIRLRTASSIPRLAAAVALMLSATPALAGKASFSISPGAAVPYLAAVMNPTLIFPNDKLSRASIGFVMPRDYRDDSRVRIDLYIRVSEAPCEIAVSGHEVYRVRKGGPYRLDSAGLSVPNDGAVVLDSAEQGATARLFLGPGQLLTGQRPGDALFVSFERNGTSPGDTYGNVEFYGINVTYRTQD